MKVTKDMNIGEAVKSYPRSAEVMLSYGLHCIGCHVNAFESIEQGAKVHGMSDEQIDEMMQKINKTLDSPDEKKEVSSEFSLTDKAAEKLKEISEKENKSGYGLKIEVVPGGCAGFQYSMGFIKEPEGDDTVIEAKGFKLFIDSQSMNMLQGASMDYVESLQGAGFKIENPNFTNSCSCGNSHG